MPSSAKDKGESQGQWFWTSKEKKAVHSWKWKSTCLVNKCLLGLAETMKAYQTLHLQAWASFSHHTQLIFFVDNSAYSSILSYSHLVKFFRHLSGTKKKDFLTLVFFKKLLILILNRWFEVTNIAPQVQFKKKKMPNDI